MVFTVVTLSNYHEVYHATYPDNSKLKKRNPTDFYTDHPFPITVDFQSPVPFPSCISLGGSNLVLEQGGLIPCETGITAKRFLVVFTRPQKSGNEVQVRLRISYMNYEYTVPLTIFSSRSADNHGITKGNLAQFNAVLGFINVPTITATITAPLDVPPQEHYNINNNGNDININNNNISTNNTFINNNNNNNNNNNSNHTFQSTQKFIPQTQRSPTPTQPSHVNGISLPYGYRISGDNSPAVNTPTPPIVYHHNPIHSNVHSSPPEDALVAAMDKFAALGRVMDARDKEFLSKQNNLWDWVNGMIEVLSQKIPDLWKFYIGPSISTQYSKRQSQVHVVVHQTPIELPKGKFTWLIWGFISREEAEAAVMEPHTAVIRLASLPGILAITTKDDHAILEWETDDKIHIKQTTPDGMLVTNKTVESIWEVFQFMDIKHLYGRPSFVAIPQGSPTVP